MQLGLRRWLFGAAWVASACNTYPDVPSGPGQRESKIVATASAPSASGAPAPPPSSVSGPVSSAEPIIEEPATVSGALWNVDALSDVGPAGPASAFESGVVLVTKEPEVLVARLGGATFSELNAPSDHFTKYGVGPAVLGGSAYFVNGSSLYRARIQSKSLEVLAKDARRGTRVAVAHYDGPRSKQHAVAYVAVRAEDKEPLARLWIDGHSVIDLSPEGSTASSVTLLEEKERLLAVVLEGRTSMSPLHARYIQAQKDGPELTPDKVVWVGPPAQALTELNTLSNPRGGAFAFIALEQTATSFGLAQLNVDRQRDLVGDVNWLIYQNGMDPAPVATGSVCGKAVVLHALPMDARPHAPQLLRLAYVQDGKLGETQTIASSRAFTNVSIAGNKTGAIVAWVADRRTWAMRVQCKK